MKTFLITLLAITTIGNANAQNPGTLDLTFGTGGFANTNIHSFASDDLGRSLLIQPDGKYVVAGISDDGTNYHFAVARYNSNGSPDNTFSGDGKEFTVLSSGMDLANAAALQADGKILVCGNSGGKLALVRYNSNGSPDNTFGSGGIVFTAVSPGSEGANAMIIQPDGKILVGGYAFVSGTDDIVLVRYNTNGTLDNTFGTQGILISPLGTGNETLWSLALQPDGKILAGGYMSTGQKYEFVVARVTAGGSIDNTFGKGGYATAAPGTSINIATCMALQPDGKIILAGRSFSAGSFDFALCRFDANGNLDTGFGNGGTQVKGVGIQDFSSSVLLQQNGKIIVAGYSNMTTGADFVLLRYSTSGVLDNTFGNGGIITNSISAGADELRSAVLQPDGKLVAAGAINGGSNANDFVVARYNFECGNAIGTPVTIAGSTTTCPATKIYSINPVNGATSYTWTLPGGWTGSSTSNSITAKVASSGTIYVAAKNSCSTSATASLAVIVTVCTSIHENNEASASSMVYPNPSSGIVTIETGSGNKFEYAIYNLLGMKVGSGEFAGKFTLDLTAYSAGKYLIRLSDKTNLKFSNHFVIRE